jgi:S-formylglutathione hydrolase FrmB
MTRTIVVPAPALRGNLLHDPAEQKAIVYLPAGYENSDRRYPVLYLLHGFSLRSVLPDWEEVTHAAMDTFVMAHPDKAFIVVIPNGANAVDGSFYMDSSVGGNWDRFISKDLIGFIDSHFRTIPDRRSRAVVGHSMGGFGVLRMLMLHPDIYSVGYAISPCCLDLVADMASENPAWLEVLQMRNLSDIRQAADHDKFWATALAAFAIAASPDPQAALLADMPYRSDGNHLVPVPSVIKQWKERMPLALVDSHVGALRQATAIGIDYGYQDEFTHIPLTAREFGGKLLTLGVPTVIEGYRGDHNSAVPERFGSRVIPFVAGHLQFQR